MRETRDQVIVIVTIPLLGWIVRINGSVAIHLIVIRTSQNEGKCFLFFSSSRINPLVFRLPQDTSLSLDYQSMINQHCQLLYFTENVFSLQQATMQVVPLTEVASGSLRLKTMWQPRILMRFTQNVTKVSGGIDRLVDFLVCTSLPILY